MQRYKEAILYIIFIVLGFVFAIVQVRPQVMDLYHTEKSIKSKTAEFADLERKLETLKASDMAKLATSSAEKTIYRPPTSGMDAESSFTVIFDDIIEMARYNGVKIYSIGYSYNPPEDEFIQGAAAQYNVCDLKTQIVADYLDLESFLKELYKYPYLINIEKLELTPYAKNKRILIANLAIKLYSSKS